MQDQQKVSLQCIISLTLKVSKYQKDFLVSSILSKKSTKKFELTTTIPQVNLFLFIFWEKLNVTLKEQKDIPKSTDLQHKIHLQFLQYLGCITLGRVSVSFPTIEFPDLQFILSGFGQYVCVPMRISSGTNLTPIALEP